MAMGADDWHVWLILKRNIALDASNISAGVLPSLFMLNDYVELPGVQEIAL